MWNQKKSEQTKQNRNRLIDTETILVVVRGERYGKVDKIGKGDKEVQTCSCKIKKSQRCNIQDREYRQQYCNNFGEKW